MKTEGIYKLFKQCEGVCTDSRKTRKNSLFFALKGENFNGNKYAARAIDQGCKYAIADDPSVCDNEHIFQVDNSLEALQKLARYHRRQVNTPIIGITGSNGKTTTKELIQSVLSAKYKVYATPGNHNNHIGVPLSLLEIRDGHELAVIEMGANHPGEIADLCAIAEPDLGIITNIGQAHLEGFGNLESIARTKLGLFESVMQKDGHIFVNLAYPELAKHSQNYPHKTTYGTPAGSNKATIRSTGPELIIEITSQNNENIRINAKMTGNYNRDNYLAAFVIGQYFGLEPEAIKQKLEAYEPANMRSQLIQTAHNRILLDAYNANPTSMAAALESLKASREKHKIIILGDMLELGGESPQLHQHSLQKALECKAEQTLLVGSSFEEAAKKAGKLPNSLYSFADTQACIKHLKEANIKGAYILIKGSRKLKLEELTNYL